jgi:hypothetical protein
MLSALACTERDKSVLEMCQEHSRLHNSGHTMLPVCEGEQKICLVRVWGVGGWGGAVVHIPLQL